MKTPRRLLAALLLWPIVFAQADELPIGDGETYQPILVTYGAFVELAGTHLHEGVDLMPSSFDKNVYAIRSGTLVAVDDLDSELWEGRRNVMVVVSSYLFKTGINYVHVVSGNRPAGNNGPRDPGGPWKVGDHVNAGDRLGSVQAFPTPEIPDHLHVDFGAEADPYFANFLAPFHLIRRPTSDPLDSMSPNSLSANQDPRPYVSDDIRFRVAWHDRNGTKLGDGPAGPGEQPRNDNLYFDLTAGDHLVVGRRSTTATINGEVGAGTADIDILALAWDTEPITGGRIGLKALDLRIAGKTHGADSGVHRVFQFSGNFLAGDLPAGYHRMRDTDARWARTIYANDEVCDSTDRFAKYQVDDRGKSWYQVTNYDGDQIVEVHSTGVSDRDCYWNSDGLSAQSFWFPVDATSNAQAAFPDDIYEIRVFAHDYGRVPGTGTREVILDNWHQTLKANGKAYKVDDYVILENGDGFLSNQRLAIHLVPLPLREGQPLNDAIDILQADRLGRLADVIINHPLDQPGEFALVADYNDDGIYQSPLDAATTIEVTARSYR